MRQVQRIEEQVRDLEKELLDYKELYSKTEEELRELLKELVNDEIKHGLRLSSEPWRRKMRIQNVLSERRLG